MPAKDSYVMKSYHVFNIPTMVSSVRATSSGGWPSADARKCGDVPGKTDHLTEQHLHRCGSQLHANTAISTMANMGIFHKGRTADF